MKREPMSVLESDNHDIEKPKSELATLQRLLDSSPDVICSIDGDGRFVYVSAACRNVWGYEPKELAGKHHLDLVIPNDHSKTIAAAAMIMSGVDLTSFQNHFIKKSGSVVPVLWSAKWDENDEVMYCVAKDISQIKKTTDEKRQLDKRLKRAYDLANIGWWEYDVATQTYTSSDELFMMYGLPVPPSNQISLRGFLACVHPDDRKKMESDLTLICQENYINYEHRVIKPTGEVIYMIHYAEVMRDEAGNPVAIHGTAKDITKRKLYQLKLEESEQNLQRYSQRLSDILESIGDGFYAVDRNWKVTYWNRKAEELLRRKREDVIGKNLWDVYQDAVPLKFFSNYHRAVDENITVQFEEFFPPLKMWVEVVAYPSSEGLSVYFQDVTEKKKQQQELQIANERFELIAKATSDALWDWDVLANNYYFNSGFTTLFGHENVADKVYKNWLENIYDEDKNVVLQSVSTALKDETVKQWQSEYRFFRQDGTLAYVLDRGFIIRDGNGNAVRMVGSMQDITKVKETDAKMRKLSLVAEETVNVVVITDANDQITWVNRAFTDLTEYSLKEAVGKKPGDLLQGRNTNQQTKQYLQECVRKRIPFHCEIINYTKSGREYWMEIKGQPLFDKNGKLEQFFAIQTDITARKKAEEMMRLSEEKYRLLFHSSPRPMFTFDSETYQVVDVNHAAAELYGYSKKEFLQLRIKEIKLPEDEEEMIATVESLRSGKSSHFQKIVRHRKKNGEPFYIEITSFPIQLTTGVHIMVFGIDMTEKIQLQQKLIEEKVFAQKQIARAIIHAQETERSEIGRELHDNVCQLLTTSKLYIENIRYMPEQREEFTRKGIELLMKSINEIRCLSRQLVSPVTSNMDFKNSIDELIMHYRSMDLFKIQLNYISNAEHPDGDLKTAVIRILQEQLNNTVKYAKSSVVEICITSNKDTLELIYKDNGVGFEPSQVKRGLGLANIKNRVDAYQGTVKLKSAAGKGVCMEIKFPLRTESGSMHFEGEM